MIYYQPVALHEALKRVKEVHPISLTMLETGEGLQGKEIWNALADKLDRTPPAEIGRLEQTLSGRERKMLQHLINHPSSDIRYKVSLFTNVSPEYMKPEILWEYVVTHLERPESAVLAGAVEKHQAYSSVLGDYRGRILRELAKGGLEAVASEFWRIAKMLNSYEKARDEIRLDESSRLGQLVKAKLLPSMRVTWLLVDSNYFDRALKQTSFTDFLDVLVTEYLIWSKRSEKERVDDRYFGRFLALLDADAHRQKGLEAHTLQAWKWYKDLLAFRRIQDVFSSAEDNERFVFWWGYKDQMVELPEVDRVNERLFMNFGKFGVLEFARVGNAAFFYTSNEFARVVQFQRDSGYRMKNNEFKRREDPLIRRNHTRGTWQARFARDLRVYLRQGLVADGL